MAPLCLPRSLKDLCTMAINRFTIWYSHWGLKPDQIQFQELQYLIFRQVPPSMLEGLLQSAMKMAATEYALTARSINFLLQLYVHPKIKDLNLSDLAFMGDVSLDDLDIVETCLETILPNLTSLTFIDLSTNLYKCTWPSCSTRMLNIIGQYCPHITVLNLNNNNRVNAEGLFYLCPSEERGGCPLLEKLYIQDSSVEPEDVANVLWRLPNITILGYKEVGSAISILHSWRRRCSRFSAIKLKLTHFDNTESRLIKTDGKILPLIRHYTPQIIILKVRINDNDSIHLAHFKKLRHLELRTFNERDNVDSLGPKTLTLISSQGKYLYSLTVYGNELLNSHVSIITQHCHRLEKLLLITNSWTNDADLSHSINNLQRLQILNLRIGDNELVQSPNAGSLVKFLIEPCLYLEEIYLLLRSSSVTHQFFIDILDANPLSNMKIFVCDAPRRTLIAPMVELTCETAILFILNCISLKILGNLISWMVHEAQMNELNQLIKESNFDIRIIRTAASRVNVKYFE